MMFLLLIVFFLWGTIASGTEDWISVKRDEYISHNLEDGVPLKIKTSSATGSNNVVSVQFYNHGEESAGAVEIEFGTVIKYKIKNCKLAPSEFGVTIPSEVDKFWKITKIASPLSLTIHCNDVEVAYVPISSDPGGCDTADWYTHWSRMAKKIKFALTDTASDFYWGQLPECTRLNPNWSNMRTNQAFPVIKGTVVSLSCAPGFQLTGDQTVTCSVDTDFQYGTQPQCVTCPDGQYKSDVMNTCTSCDAGEEPNPTKSACVTCPDGKYKSDGMNTCTSCDAGEEPNPTKSACVECPGGQYRSSEMTKCAYCEPGKEPSSAQGACVSCPDGEFKSANMIKCAECASVYHIPTPDKTTCAFYCDEPTIPEAMFNPGGKVIVGTVVTVMCVDYTRYSLLGNKEVTCPDTKSWSDLPECRLCVERFKIETTPMIADTLIWGRVPD